MVVLNYYSKNRGKYKRKTKEERASSLHNIICPNCKYHNHEFYIKKYGKCNLCGHILDKDYFIRTMLRRLNNG